MNSCDCCQGRESTSLFTEAGFELVRCSTCDLLYVLNPPRELIWQHGHGNYRARDDSAEIATVSRDVAAALAYAKPGKWLDVGCGQGLLLRLAAQHGFDAYGIEVDPIHCQVAGKRSPGKVFNQPFETLDFPDHSFDVVSLINVFSHLRSPRLFFMRVRELLRKDGILLLRTGEVGPDVEKRHLPRWNLGDHLHFLGVATLKRYCEEVGFEVLNSSRVWVPQFLSSREYLAYHFNSLLRNLATNMILLTPGAHWAFQKWFLARHRGNPIFDSVYVLRPKMPLAATPSGTGTPSSQGLS